MDIITEMLATFELSEILERANVSEYEALEILIRYGYLNPDDVGFPNQRYEETEETEYED